MICWLLVIVYSTSRLCLVTQRRRLSLQFVQAANEAEPRLHRFPGRALEPVKCALVLSQKFRD